MAAADFDIHPELLAMLAEFDAVPEGDTIAEKRANWRKFCFETQQPRPAGMAVEDAAFEGPAGAVPIRVYRPAAAAPPPAPCVLYIHGGGFMTGDLDTNDTIAWGLAEGTGCVVVSTDYRLAPENPYPAAFDDCYAALRHVADNAAALGIDAGRIGVCGDSAGGNLTAAINLAARNRGGPKVAAQAILYPGLRTEGTLPSFTTYGEAPIQSTAATRKYRLVYMPDPATHTDPYACPLMAEDYGDLPPALIHVAEIDAARDEGKLYAERMAAAGVEVTYRVAERMIHSFLRARFNGPAAQAEFDVVCAFLASHLR